MPPQNPYNQALQTNAAAGAQPDPAAQQPAMPAMPPVQQTPAAPLAQAEGAAPTPPPAPASAPAEAADTDSIEKVWVEQAEQVLRGNRGNPFAQNREFTKLKAEYMQKRYGKTVKVD